MDLRRVNLASVEVDTPTPLMIASQSGDVVGMRAALANNDAVNALASTGTAFSLALQAKRFAIAEFLLELGADSERGFREGKPSALMLAAQSGQNALVKKLILNGNDIDYQDNDGFSAIAAATLNRHLTTMKILINAGADVNVAPEGKSILQHMVIDNNPLLVQLLIKANADVNFRSEMGETALRMARRAGYYDLDLMLVQAGGRL